jgi:hypothetical protein
MGTRFIKLHVYVHAPSTIIFTLLASTKSYKVRRKDMSKMARKKREGSECLMSERHAREDEKCMLSSMLAAEIPTSPLWKRRKTACTASPAHVPIQSKATPCCHGRVEINCGA